MASKPTIILVATKVVAIISVAVKLKVAIITMASPLQGIAFKEWLTPLALTLQIRTLNHPPLIPWFCSSK